MADGLVAGHDHLAAAADLAVPFWNAVKEGADSRVALTVIELEVLVGRIDDVFGADVPIVSDLYCVAEPNEVGVGHSLKTAQMLRIELNRQTGWLLTH